MKINYLEVPVEEYGTVKVEIEPTELTRLSKDLGVSDVPSTKNEDFEELMISPEDIAQTAAIIATSAFDKISDTVSMLACGFHDSLKKTKPHAKPDEVSVEFGLTIKGDAGVVLSQAGAKAAIKVTLTWNKEEH
jgi:hypothetical protein